MILKALFERIPAVLCQGSWDTDIESIANVNLDDIKLNINYDELKARLLDFEIKTLI